MAIRLSFQLPINQTISAIEPQARRDIFLANSAIMKVARRISTFKGNTASRPADLTTEDAGMQYFDTTLAAAGKPIWWTGTAWVDATGATV